MLRGFGRLGLLLGWITLVFAATYATMELAAIKYALPAWVVVVIYGTVLIAGCISIIRLYERLTRSFIKTFPVSAIPRDYIGRPFALGVGRQGSMTILVDHRSRPSFQIRGVPGYLGRNEDGAAYFEGEDFSIVSFGSTLDRYFSDNTLSLLDQGVRVLCGYELDQEAGEHLIHISEWPVA